MNVTHNLPTFDHGSFGLSGTGQLVDGAKFCAGLQALIDHPLKAIHEPQLVERVFTTIDKADLSEWLEVKKVQGLVKEVFEKWVKVSLGDSVRHIPRQRLKSDCGPKFMQQYEHRLVDTRSHELHLALPGNASSEYYPAKLTESFLAHLQTGVVSEDVFDADVLNLLDLALQHFQEALVKECADFLVENLDSDNLDNLFTFATDRNVLQLKWACYRFLQENQADIPTELQNTYRTQFDLVKSLLDKGIKLRFSPSGQTELYIEALHFETLPLLKRISDEISIHSLVMSKACGDNLLPFLEKIAPHFPKLQELIIYDKVPTDQEIPNLKKLFPKLKAFGNDAPFLKTFEEVETYLSSFAKPGASEPESETLVLRSLNLESIWILDDSQVDKLKEYLQDVYHLFIGSNEITSVVAPNATEIRCWGCLRLTTLTAPRATEIDCMFCAALETLDTPEARILSCSSCTALTTLYANHAKEINGDWCEALTTLAASEVTVINCRGSALTTLDVPDATYVNCSKCAALTALNACKAATIFCFECTALATLNANNATTIELWKCEALKTLIAPKMTEINCKGLKALTTLDASDATTIDCSGCEALETLTAPNATKIDCTGCTALTILDAPQATLTGESRIRIWTRWFWNQIRTFWNAVPALLVWLPNRLRNYINASFGR